MDETFKLRQLYKSFKQLADEAGTFFRQKDHYSISEQIDYLLALHRSYINIELQFDSDEELRSGAFTIQDHGNSARVTINYKHIVDEFETVISIIYFNLSHVDIEEFLLYCKNSSKLQEALIIKKLFGKFLD